MPLDIVSLALEVVACDHALFVDSNADVESRGGVVSRENKILKKTCVVSWASQVGTTLPYRIRKRLNWCSYGLSTEGISTEGP